MQFQSTRPRGARQIEGQSTVLYHVVSIHAPAWGATADAYAYELHINRFNPRARVGRDGSHPTRRERLLVSIHAPAWGATETVAI